MFPEDFLPVFPRDFLPVPQMDACSLGWMHSSIGHLYLRRQGPLIQRRLRQLPLLAGD